jgi:class 3 adenylate cyclase
MEQPRIQYAKTTDGVSIAYWTAGSGPAFVQMPGNMFGPTGSVIAGDGRPQRWTERLAQRRMVVRYNPRGFGQSDRNIMEFSLEGWLLDLEAIVDHLRLERFALFGGVQSGPIAIAYAARHPDRVSHLILYSTSARGENIYSGADARREALEELADKDWETYTEVITHINLGWQADEQARRLAAFLRENTTREALHAVQTAQLDLDVTPLLPAVRCPTLVMYRRRYTRHDPAESRLLASRIPGAQLVELEGDQQLPYVGDTESVLRAIEDFLGDAPPPQAETGVAGLCTVLWTDLVGHTEMMRRLGDARGRDVLREHERITRDTLNRHGGTEVKTMGDGFMASFGSVNAATECAIALQRAFAERNETASERLDVRVGLNAGEPIEEDGDLFGSAVILASRIASQASGGEILASNVVRELAAGKEFLFSDRGVADLKGFDEPVRLFEVRWKQDVMEERS